MMNPHLTNPVLKSRRCHYLRTSLQVMSSHQRQHAVPTSYRDRSSTSQRRPSWTYSQTFLKHHNNRYPLHPNPPSLTRMMIMSSTGDAVVYLNTACFTYNVNKALLTCL